MDTAVLMDSQGSGLCLCARVCVHVCACVHMCVWCILLNLMSSNVLQRSVTEGETFYTHTHLHIHFCQTSTQLKIGKFLKYILREMRNILNNFFV